jgi:hypothetical protein
MNERFVCCFCGNAIQPESPDIGSLLYTTDWDKPKEGQHEQGLFCHAECLQAKVHPTIKLYVLALLSKEQPSPEQLARLPEFLR